MIVLLYLADEDAESWWPKMGQLRRPRRPLLSEDHEEMSIQHCQGLYTSEGTGVQEEGVTKEVSNFLQNLREP